MIDSKDQTSLKVLQIASAFVDHIELTGHSGLRKGWDSLMHVKILLAVEEEFNKEVPPEKFGELTTIDQIANWICGANEKL